MKTLHADLHKQLAKLNTIGASILMLIVMSSAWGDWRKMAIIFTINVGIVAFKQWVTFRLLGRVDGLSMARAEMLRVTGQGLAVSRAAIERHGGRITFDTTLGRGTTFHVRLPLDTAMAHAAL